MISARDAATHSMMKDMITQPQNILAGPPPAIGYDMVVDRPYGTEARMKHMNTTCHVDRLRDNSGRYPKDSRLESAWGLSILFSAIFAVGRACTAHGIMLSQSEDVL